MILLALLFSASALAGDTPNRLTSEVPPARANSTATANAVNSIMGISGQSLPRPDFSALHAQTAQSQANVQSMNSQMEGLQSLFERYSSQPQAGSNYVSSSAGDKIAAASNRWLARKLTETSSRLPCLSNYETRELHAELASWRGYSDQKKQVLVLTDGFADTATRLRQSTIRNDLQSYSEIALQSGLNSLTEASHIAGGHASGSFVDVLGLSESQLNLARGLLDTGLSLTPGVSVGKDAYEALSGRSLLDGSELDLTSRSFAVLGVATAGGSNIIRTSFRGLIRIAHASHARGLLGHGFESAIRLAESGITNITRHTPLHPGGLERIAYRLPGFEAGGHIPRELMQFRNAAETFRSATYWSYETTQAKGIWRLASVDPTNPRALERMLNAATTTAHEGAFYTSIRPTSPTMGIIESALERSWASNANIWVYVEVPAGQRLYEGVTASIQRIGRNMSEMVGGGNQIFIADQVPREWIKEIGRFQ